MYLLDVAPLDLGPDVRAVGLDLVEPDEDREPVRGADAAEIWSRLLPAVAGTETWALDFFSHLDRVHEYCERHEIETRDATQRSLVIPALDGAKLKGLLERFQKETFGVRTGGVLPAADAALEADLARRGADAYHKAFANYFFCAVCGFEDGSLVVLSEKLWANELIRRAQPALKGLDVEVRLST